MGRNRGRRLMKPFPLPKDTVLCGELTLNPSQPHNAVLPFPKDVPLDIRSDPFQNLHSSQTAGVGAEFWVQLMTFLKTHIHALHFDHVEITVEKGSKYLVRESETSFRLACAKPEVRTWLQERVIDEGRDAAMIVGMYTYCNASYKYVHQNSLVGQVGASDPTGAGGGNLRAAVADGIHRTFNVAQEQIFAIEYKKITFKRFSKKKVEEAKLETGPNRWEVFFGDRTKGTAEEEQENIFEFNLDDNEDNADNKESDDEFEDVGDEAEPNATTSMEFDGSVADEL